MEINLGDERIIELQGPLTAEQIRDTPLARWPG